jgi:hypothetical protein
MSQEIDNLIEKGLIEKTKGDYIREKFQDFRKAVEEWSERAYSIVVTEETQKELMAEAKEGRVLLKAKRIEVEKVRKSLKEQSLNEGRLIDSVAKDLTGLIEPAEKHLELQEKFIEIQEQNKRIQLKADRTLLLQPYKDVIDPNSIQLDLITEEAFTSILNGARFALESKKAEALRIEKEKKENARKEVLFQERRLEVVEYKSFYDSKKDIILTRETEQSDFDSLINDLKFRSNEHLKAQAKLAKENEALKKQNEKKAQQIKQLKQDVKQAPIIAQQTTNTQSITDCASPLNEINSTDVMSCSEGVIETTPNIATVMAKEPLDLVFVDTEDENIIIVNRFEYEVLKKRYDIAKTAMASVLMFVVPQNLRDLINKAINDIAEADRK